MTQSRKLFEHLKLLLPEWGIRRGYRGADKKLRPMVYTIPGPSYHPNPSEGEEHSIKLLILLPTDVFDEYEVTILPLKMWCGKFGVKNPSYYVRYNTDYVSRLADKKITLPGDTPEEEVASKAASFLQRSFNGLCAHFVKSLILNEQKTKPIDRNVTRRYLKRLFTKELIEDKPSWLESCHYSGDYEARFHTNVYGSEKQWHNTFKRVQITGILSAERYTDWHGEELVKISCFTSAYSDGHEAHWPWRMRSCHTYKIKGMPSFEAFKLAVLSFMEDRIKSRYRYARRKSEYVVWDDTLPEGVTPPALLRKETA